MSEMTEQEVKLQLAEIGKGEEYLNKYENRIKAQAFLSSAGKFMSFLMSLYPLPNILNSVYNLCIRRDSENSRHPLR